jgi:hypothetical protein
MNNAQKGSAHRQFYSSPHRQRVISIDRVTDFELKQFRIRAGFVGFAPFDGYNNYSTAWTRTKYRTRRVIKTDQNELVAYTYDYLDPYNGAGESETYTPPGFLNPSGIPSETFESPTHSYAVYPNGWRQDIYLEDPLDIQDHIDDLQTRFDEIISTGDMKRKLDFTHRASPGGANGSVFWEIPSKINSAAATYSLIEIRPDEASYPWDESFYFGVLAAGTENGSHPGRWTTSGELPYASTFYDHTSALDFNFGSDQFALKQCQYITLSKCLFRTPTGVGCGLAGYDPATNYNYKDMIYGVVDLDTGSISDSRSQLILAPGIYGFDNREIHVYSGAVTHQNGSFSGSGWCRPMAAIQSPRTDWNQFSDICP